MAKGLVLWISEDILFMTPSDFDVPTPDAIRREQVAAQAMALWADNYQDVMEPRRLRWLAAL